MGLFREDLEQEIESLIKILDSARQELPSNWFWWDKKIDLLKSIDKTDIKIVRVIQRLHKNPYLTESDRQQIVALAIELRKLVNDMLTKSVSSIQKDYADNAKKVMIELERILIHELRYAKLPDIEILWNEHINNFVFKRKKISGLHTFDALIKFCDKYSIDIKSLEITSLRNGVLEVNLPESLSGMINCSKTKTIFPKDYSKEQILRCIMGALGNANELSKNVISFSTHESPRLVNLIEAEVVDSRKLWVGISDGIIIIFLIRVDNGKVGSIFPYYLQPHLAMINAVDKVRRAILD